MYMWLSIEGDMIKLIVSDIDGTLVPDGGSASALNPEYYDVIRELKRKNITFAACSGRQFLSMYRVFEPVAEHMYFISEGGGVVSNGRGEVLHSATLDPDTVREILVDAKKIPQMDIMVAGVKRAYCRSKDSEMYRWMVDDYRFDIEAVGDLENGINDDVAKVSLYHHNAAEALTKDWFAPKWGKRVKAVLAGKQWLDLVSVESGKGIALSFLQKKLGIKREETIVFGDNQNDIEMFQAAGHSYAVGGARREVLEASDTVCGTMESDGVLTVLKNLF